jgi:hypothetical protein
MAYLPKKYEVKCSLDVSWLVCARNVESLKVAYQTSWAYGNKGKKVTTFPQRTRMIQLQIC